MMESSKGLWGWLHSSINFPPKQKSMRKMAEFYDMEIVPQLQNEKQ